MGGNQILFVKRNSFTSRKPDASAKHVSDDQKSLLCNGWTIVTACARSCPPIVLYGNSNNLNWQKWLPGYRAQCTVTEGSLLAVPESALAVLGVPIEQSYQQQGAKSWQ